MKDKHKLLMVTLVVAMLAVALALTTPRGQTSLAADGILYVDADANGSNNGSFWEDAFTTLQPALEAAVTGDQIWVAAGVYTPTLESTPGDPRSAAFQMKNDVAIYGGFDPSVGDVDWDDRDWVNNQTILSGDLYGNDGPDFANNSENSYHVFFHPDGSALDSSSILDGFTIMAGNANSADDPNNIGGGMYNSGSSPTLTNVTFFTNSASSGGGMYNTQSHPKLTNVTFSANLAINAVINRRSDSTSNSNARGAINFSAGARNETEKIPADSVSNIILNGDFENGSDGSWNEYSSNGYNLILQGFDPTGVTPHSGEWGVWLGGAPYEVSTLSQAVTIPAGNPTLTYWIWLASQETICGNDTGKVSVNDVNVEAFDLCIDTNTSEWVQHSVNLSDYAGMTVTLTFNATLNGMNNSNFFLDDVEIPGYIVGNDGGGMYNYESRPTLINVTFFGNEALFGSGGGMYNYTSSPTLTNTILWGDAPDEIFNEDSTSVVTYSDVQGGYDGAGNINVNPLFVNPTNGDFHLGQDSPCIDSGSNTAPFLPEYDFEGNNRVLDGDNDGNSIVDMGVDEYLPPTITTITSDTPDPSQAGEPFAVAFMVTSTLGTPTGVVNVTLSDNLVSCSGTLVGGLGSCELTLTTTGSYTLTANFEGAADFAPSSDSDIHNVVPASTITTITGDVPDPSQIGEPFTVTFTVTSTVGTPTGVVTITIRGSLDACSTALVDRQGSCGLTIDIPGDYIMIATYEGGADFASSSDSEPHTVFDYYKLYFPLVVK